MAALQEWGWFFGLVAVAVLFYRYCALKIGWVSNLKFSPGMTHILFSLFFMVFSTWAAYLADKLRLLGEGSVLVPPLWWSVILTSVLLLVTSFFIEKGLLFGCVLVSFGAIANIAVVVLNKGQMPVKIYGLESIVIVDAESGALIYEATGRSKDLIETIENVKSFHKNIRVSFEKSNIHTVMTPDCKLQKLSDIILVQFANLSFVISFGDLLLFLGIFLFLIEVFTRKEVNLNLTKSSS